MSRQLEQDQEIAQSKRAMQLYRVCSGGLEAAVSRHGGTLYGFSTKFNGYEVLITLRAEFPGGPQVSFIGAHDLAAALVKANAQAKGDTLRWRADKFVGKS